MFSFIVYIKLIDTVLKIMLNEYLCFKKSFKYLITLYFLLKSLKDFLKVKEVTCTNT